VAQEDKPLSPEAEARKTIDGLKGDLAKATEALTGTVIHSRLVQSFAEQGHRNPFDLATRAQSQFGDVTAETPSSDLSTRAKAWYEAEASMFGVGGGGGEPPVTEPTQPDTPLADVSPNLTAAGLQPEKVATVIGSKEYFEQGWHERSDAEQIAAMRGPSPTLVSPDKVRVQQQDINPFGG